MSLLIVGTGRSGTGYIARLLSNVGVPCGHEAVYGPAQALGVNPPQWRHWSADASWLAIPRLAEHDGPVAVGLRHPWRVVDSLDRTGLLAWERDPDREKPGRIYRAAIAAWTPEIFGHDDPLVRAAHFTAAWPAALGVRVPDVVYRVEALTADEVVRLAGLAGHAVTAAQAALDQTPRNVNHERAAGDHRDDREIYRYLRNRAPGDVWDHLEQTYAASYPDAFGDGDGP